MHPHIKMTMETMEAENRRLRAELADTRRKAAALAQEFITSDVGKEDSYLYCEMCGTMWATGHQQKHDSNCLVAEFLTATPDDERKDDDG